MSTNETVAAADPQPAVAPAGGASAETSGTTGPTADTGTAAAAASSTTPTAPPATATAAAMDPSAAVNAAMMAERVIRRASLTGMGLGNMNMGLLSPGGGGMGMNMNMGLMNPTDGMAMNLGDSTLFERAMALQSEQHQNTMALARASLGLDPNDPRASLGLGTLTPRGSLGLGTMGTTRASLGLGTMGPRASLGLGTMGARRASLGFGSMPARPSLSLGTMPVAPGAAPAEGSPSASNANSNAASGGGQSDQQTLLRLAKIRTARAEVQAAQARLAELETHTALAASQAAKGQGGNNEDLPQAQGAAATATGDNPTNGSSPGNNNAKAASSASNAGGSTEGGEGGEQADARDLEAAETFLSMSGKKQQDQNASGDGAAAADGNALAANANANDNADAMMQPALGMAPGMMMPGMAALGNMNMNMLPAMQMGHMMPGFPRRVSMDLLAQNAGGLQQIPNAAFLAEAMIAERRLSNAASAAANFAVAQERRSTLPMVNGTVMQPGTMLQMNAGGNSNNISNFPSGVPVPKASQTGSASTKNSRTRPADAPRRPLSAYNFFFIDERERILKAMKKRDEKKAAEKEDGGDKDGDESNKEDEGKDDQDGEKQEEDPLKDVDLDDSDFSPSTYDELMTLRLNNKEKPRPHRKTHGKIGFQTLAKLIASRWKALGDDRRDHYKSLAAIDMDNYKEKTHEYQKKKMKNSAGEAIATGESSV